MKRGNKPRLIKNPLYSEILLFLFVLATITIGYQEYYMYANLLGFLLAVTWALEFVFFKSRNFSRLKARQPIKIHPFVGILCFASMMFIMSLFESSVYRLLRTVIQVSILMVIVFNITRVTRRTWPLEAGLFLSVIVMFAFVSDDIINAVANSQRYKLNLGGDTGGLNPNVYGTLLNLQVLFFLRFLFITRPAFRKDFFVLGMTLLGGLATLISSYQILVVLGSRQNQLWLAISLMSIVILFGRGRIQVSRIFVAGILVLLLGGLSFYLVRESAFMARYESMISEFTGGTQQEGSSYIRLGLLKASKELWFSSPIIGLGNDGFAINSGFGMYSHNQYTELLVNYGVLGFCLFYSLHFFVVRRAYLMWRFGNLVEKAEAMWLIVAISGILLSNIFQPTYYEKSFGLALATVAAVGYNQSRGKQTRLIDKKSC